MKRPQSAKQVRNYLAQTVNDDGVSFEEQPRHFAKITKKNMFHAITSSNDLSRLLPKKIQQDKEQLYYQALQLKNNLNEINQKNIRLKTKVALLQRQKDRAGRTQEQRMSKGKSNNFLNATRTEKENGIINNLKKIVRETKEENQNLQNQIIKIKKNVKYTKINQIQIEKQTVFEENKKLSKLLQKYEAELETRIRQDEEVHQLENELAQKTSQLRDATEDNIKYQQILDELEAQHRQVSEKLLIQQRKWQRDFAVERRRVQQLTKHVENLKQEVKNLKQMLEEEKKRTAQAKRQTRPASSRPYKNMDSTSSLKNPTAKEKEEALQLNEKLKTELEEAKRRLAESQNQLNNNPKPAEQPKYVKTVQANRFQIELHEQQQYASDFQQTTTKPQPPKTLSQPQPITQPITQPTSPFLLQLRELLTYRMKYNRYPFKQLKADIELSPLNTFMFEDLFSMLIAEPFFLTKPYALQFLKICYKKNQIQNQDELSSDVFLQNLRLVIGDFSLLEEEEEEVMLYKIAQFMTKNRASFQAQFKKLKAKDNTITKDQLVQVLKAFPGITQQQIQLAICYISVSTDSLKSISYQDFLNRFYISKSKAMSHSQAIQQEQLSLGENEDMESGELIADDELI